MKKEFSKHWISSKQPRKQRKYLYNAPLNIRQIFVSAHLSKELRKKHNKRSIILKKGDKVKIMRGQFKNKFGKIEKVNLKDITVFVEGIQTTKKDGSKVYIPIHPSNIIITELNLEDKHRREILERK